jgi:hypothetical protein
MLKKRRNWRPGLLSLGLFVIAAAALGGILLINSITRTESVLVAATDLQRGQVLEVQDVRVADIVVAPGVNALKLDEQQYLGGPDAGEPVRVVRGFVPEGAVLSEGHFQEQSKSLQPNEALIGVRLESGEYPSLLDIGDQIELYVVSSRNEEEPAELLGNAEVWAMWQTPSDEDRTLDLVADLVVDESLRPRALQAHADGTLRLTLIRTG